MLHATIVKIPHITLNLCVHYGTWEQIVVPFTVHTDQDRQAGNVREWLQMLREYCRIEITLRGFRENAK